MAKLPDAEVIVHGLLVSMDEKRDYETKSLTGHRATIVGAGGGAAIVNFSLDDVLPFAPAMSQVVWRVRSGAWSVEGNSGMSTKYLGPVDEAHLIALAAVLSDNAERFAKKN